MPLLTTDDGVDLHYEEAGEGEPLVFVHEFAGDHRSWEPQMRHLSRSYRCIAYNARGYTPSSLPEPEAFSQDRARLDILAMLDGLGIERAHICGLSMGGFAALHFGLHHPDRARSLVVAGCGYGAEPDQRDQFAAEVEKTAVLIESGTADGFADRYSVGPGRTQFKDKDPRGWQEFRDQLAEHSLQGSARTMRGVQKLRPSLFDLEDQLVELEVPTLVLTGDEDTPCVLPSVYLKRTIRSAALVIVPNSGHTVNLEEPDLFNRSVGDFLHQVSTGRWPVRAQGVASSSILGTDD